MKISLAAKCQLLFGAAVVLIVAAALIFPWRRMEQLTVQLNERSASAMADAALMSHVLEMKNLSADKSSHDATSPATQPTSPTTQSIDGRIYLPPRLIGRAIDPEIENLPPFEIRAFTHFAKYPNDEFFARDYERPDGTQGYRFARPLFARQSCLECHASDNSAMQVQASGEPAAEPPPPNPRFDNLLGLVSIDMPSQTEASQVLLNRVFILTAGLLAGTLAVVVFYLIITRLILQPVRVLQVTAEKVSQGNLNIRSDISTGDEFQQLSETFNTMLGNLKKNADQLQSINKSLDLKLGQMAESNVALYESNRLKSEFLANVSHELRTPLNSILGFADLLKDSTTTSPDAKTTRYVQNILNSGRNLLELINDLLDLAKIEAGRMEVRSEPLVLNTLFEGLGSILKPLAEAKEATIVAIVASDVPLLQTDAAKLQQVLYNFLSNALKFSPKGGKIDLAATREGEDHVRITVTDQGPGIDPAQHETIFEKFRQLDASTTRQHSGTGLGLAISKELMLLLGGSIGVRSTSGQGATFWIVLPLKIESGIQDLRSRFMLV